MQSLAEDGALILGERLRTPEERTVVAEVIGNTLGVKVRSDQ
jgi:midasin (ATPase involved in ribosome maturation)